MTETRNKARQQAEIAFDATKSQFFARGHAVEELNSIVLAREEKTVRLREARLARQLEESWLPGMLPVSTRIKKD